MSSLFIKICLFFLEIISYLPLPVTHFLGVILGLANFAIHRKSRNHARSNLTQSALVTTENINKTLLKNAIENGKSIFETFNIWFKPHQKVLAYVKTVHGWDVVESAIQQGNGIIFLAPHLGCFEIASLYYGASFPVTVLYRPPKQTWLHPLILQGRERGKIKLAPANMEGVRGLLVALKHGEAIAILPDQTPAAGEGVWADFFKKPAYTMTLASKLAAKTSAAVFMVYGERLSWGRGYVIHITQLENGAINTVQGLNHAVEKQIAQNPVQYLWAYPRYKVRQFNREKLIEFLATKNANK